MGYFLFGAYVGLKIVYYMCDYPEKWMNSYSNTLGILILIVAIIAIVLYDKK